jgi:hypothetical protein
LSTFCSGVLGVEPCTSATTRASHNAQHIAFAAAIYSESQLDCATTFYFFDCQVIGLFTKKKISPGVLFLASTSLAKSASLNPVNNA